MAKVKEFLDTKIVKKDVGEETYLTWRETISYARQRRTGYVHLDDGLEISQLLFDERTVFKVCGPYGACLEDKTVLRYIRRYQRPYDGHYRR